MTRINTNVSSLNAQKTLARSNVQLQEALTRLSTGLRINSGKDDPAGLIASEIGVEPAAEAAAFAVTRTPKRSARSWRKASAISNCSMVSGTACWKR